MREQPRPTLSVDDVVLDLEAVELRRDGAVVAVEPQVFDLIAYLARNSGRVVSRQEIIDAVWKGRIVSDSAISTRINAARQALGDDGRTQRFIKTVHGRGFRFVDGVSAVILPGRESARLNTNKPSIVVLPFTNLSGDKDQEFFADGITEDIITELSRYHSLDVIARHSSFNYKGHSLKAKAIANDLGVRYVLDGSIRRAGERILITAQLVDADSDAHIWTERYDRRSDDVFSVQEEVSRSVVATLPGRLESADLNKSERKSSDSLDAYECLLQGRQHHLRITQADNVEAIELLDRAIQLDPDYADAHAWKACAVGQAWRNEFRERTDRLWGECVNGAQHALTLDAENTEAHRIMCRVHLMQREFDASEYHLDKALTLNPNDPRLIAQRGINLTWLGRPNEGADWLRRALRLDPYQDHAYNVDLALALFVGRHYAEAIRVFRQDFDPPYDHLANMAACAAHMEASDLARSAVARVLKTKPDFTIGRYLEVLPYKRESDREHHRDGLYKAGLPD